MFWGLAVPNDVERLWMIFEINIYLVTGTKRLLDTENPGKQTLPRIFPLSAPLSMANCEFRIR